MIWSYIRVSTVQQADEGASLAAQTRTIAGYAHMHGWKVDRELMERAVSGGTPLRDRPQGRILLAEAKAGDIVLVAKMDRMFRNAGDALDVLAELTKRRVALHLIDLGGDTTTNGISKLVFTILAAVAENERDMIRERTRTVKQSQKAAGAYLGGKVPWHCVIGRDGKLVVDPARAKALEKMRALHADGVALRTIAAEMTAAGLPVSASGVRKLLASKAGADGKPA